MRRSPSVTTCAAPCSGCAGPSPTSTGSSWSASCPPSLGVRDPHQRRTPHRAVDGRARRRSPPSRWASSASTRTSSPPPATATWPPPTTAASSTISSPRSSALYRDDNLRPDSSPEKLATLKPVFGVKDGDATMTAGNSTPLTDGASVALLASEEWATAHDMPGAGLLRRRRDRGGRLRQRRRRTADGTDVRGAAVACPQRADPAGLRLLRDPRGLRVGGAGHPAGVGVRGVLQGAARSGRARWARSTGPSSTSTARRWRPVIRSRRPVAGSSRSWPSSWRRRRPRRVSRCAA